MSDPEPSPDSLRKQASDIFARALESCSLQQAFARKIRTAPGPTLLLEGHAPLDLQHIRRIRIVAIGKAAIPMLHGIYPLLPAACDISGILIAPQQPANFPRAFQFFPGGHPVPNAASFDGARAALAMLRQAATPDPNAEPEADPAHTLCLFLISGGASAMMELPLAPDISLEDTIAFHRALVHSGASIAEINCVRKHFSAVKGGRLALAAGSCSTLSLLLSDVPPGHLDALASGPTLPDPTTVARCHEIIAQYRLMEQWPTSVQAFFNSAIPETPKAADLQPNLFTLLSSDDLAQAARHEAEHLGFHTVIDNTCDDWDYRPAAQHLLDHLRQLRATHPRVCLISTGELTVQVPANPGTGGRNQHFALHAATLLTPADVPTAILSAGSDGIDGNSSAAGAIIDRLTLHNPAITPDEAAQALEHFNANPILDRIGATLTTGPTGNNLRDLRLLLCDSPAPIVPTPNYAPL